MKQNTKLPLILIVALPILLLITTELSHITFNIMGYPIYLINFIIPLTFLVSILISKKTESKVALTIVILSLIIQCSVFVLKWVFLGTVNYVLMEITFLGFFMPQFLALLGYEVLRELNKTNKYGYLFVILLISTLIELMFYVTIFTKITRVSFIITILIKITYNLFLPKLLISKD